MILVRLAKVQKQHFFPIGQSEKNCMENLEAVNLQHFWAPCCALTKTVFLSWYFNSICKDENNVHILELPVSSRYAEKFHS